MERIDGKTANIVEENIRKMKQWFPEVFSEGKIDPEKLLLVLGEHIEAEAEKYDFTWHGKTEAMQLAQKQSTATLRPCKEESVDWEKTKNLYIEGDNLEVLRLLQTPYRNKIKAIYIDPPYNTGMDFIYEDDFEDNVKNYKEKIQEKMKSNAETSGRYHTNWLNFMYPRLKLARNLLTDDGMIFISISDKELYNLKKMCDEIFGEDNFVTTFIWEKKKKPSFLDRNVGGVTEYIVTYSKNNEKTHALSIERTEKGKKYPFNNAGNGVRILTFPEGSVSFQMEDGTIPAQDMSGGNIITELLDDVTIKDGKNANSFRLKGEWRYSQEKLDEIIANQEEIVISKVPFRPNHIKTGGEIKKIKNLFSIHGYGFPTYEDADKEMIQLFGRKIFDYSKPEKLIRRLLQSLLYNDEEAIILDFFSGSGTTGEAVWKLNQEFGKDYRFILVQLPEPLEEKSEGYKLGFKTISDIGKERLRRARKQLLEENTNHDIGFKVFQLDDSNLKKWDDRAEELEEQLLEYLNPLKEGRTEEDIVYEILLKYGIDITAPIEKKQLENKNVYVLENGTFLLCFDRNLNLSFIEALLKEFPDLKRAVFFDEGFLNDTEKLNAEQLFKQYGVTDIRVI